MAVTTISTDHVSCCSAFYEQDWVRALAEGIFHPGGADLSRRTVAAMNLPSGASLLDLGCGVGQTARMLAADCGFVMTGVDFSQANLQRAASDCSEAPIRYVQADANRLPFADQSFDGVLSECVLSLMLDKPAALREIRRILRPGGCLGITDMSVHGALPEDFAAVVAPWTCLGDALSRDAYVALFAEAGFELASVVDESQGLRDLMLGLKRRLVMLGASALVAGRAPLDIESIRYWLKRFAGQVDAGVISYLRFQLSRN